MLVTRHNQFTKPINVLNLYGEQECRNNNDKVEENWNEIIEILTMIEAAGESSVICGDLNKKVGSVIKGNHDKVTPGGKLIIELLETDKYVLVNSSDNTEGGPFTRYSTTCKTDN